MIYEVEVAVFETARNRATRLGYDWADIGSITNVSEDRIGQDGIESVEDLIRIKSLVAERVREGGTLVLNADDESSAQILEREAVKQIKKTIVYFSSTKIIRACKIIWRRTELFILRKTTGLSKPTVAGGTRSSN